MQTIVTIGGTAYHAGDRAAAHFIGIDQLVISADEYWILDFTIQGCGPNPPFPVYSIVTVVTANDDGSSPVTVFQGNIVSNPVAQDATFGWTFAYHCLDLKFRGDYVTILNHFGSGICAYNLPPDDIEYNPVYSNYSVGQIVADILQTYTNAQNLYAQNVGNFTFSGMTATLPAQTLTDLSYFTIVPQFPIRIEGEMILSILDQFIRDWYPQFSCYVDAAGNIRYVSPLLYSALSHQTLTLPNNTGGGDNVEWPEYNAGDITNCYTQYQFIGEDFDWALLSRLDLTLAPANSSTDYMNWNIYSFTQPQGSTDRGSCTITSSTTATVTSDNPAVTWASGFWPSIGGWVYFTNTTATGINITVARQLTACAAMTAGGSVSIGWDASQPLDFSDYGRYSLIGQNNPIAFVDRLFNPVDPGSGAVGLNSFVGANLRTRAAFPIPWANNGQIENIYYPAAKISWSPTCDNATVANRFPMVEVPIPCQVNRATGQILLQYPAVFGAIQAGAANSLDRGYPTTAFQGLYYDLQVAVPFSRGILTAQYPSSGYQGTAYTTYGVQRTKVVPWTEYTSRFQTASMVALAQERLVTMCDAVIEGAIMHHGLPSTINFADPFIGLYIVIPGTNPLNSNLLPVRSSVFRIPNEGVDTHQVTLRFSNKKAPFSANSRWLHPNFTRDASEQNWTWNTGTGLGDGFTPSPMARREPVQHNQRQDKFAANPQGQAINPDLMPQGRPIQFAEENAAPKRGRLQEMREGGG